MTEPNSRILLSPSDIAEMAAVSRAAVSNWRKREGDFPNQVAGSAGRPLFDRTEIIDWLQRRGVNIGEGSNEARLWAALNTIRGLVDWVDVAQVVLSFSCAVKLRQIGGALSVPEESFQAPDALSKVLSLISEQGMHDRRWHELVVTPDSATRLPGAALAEVLQLITEVPLEQLAETCDAVLTRLSTAQVKAGAEYGFVGSPTSAILASLAATHPRGRLYDPACGIGAALVDAVRRGAQPRTVYGHDISSRALLTARQRAFLHDVDLLVEQCDVLARDPDPPLEADVIVAEPPFSMRWFAEQAVTDPRFVYGTPPKASADLAWLQHVIHHLSDDGRGYVITTTGPLFRGGAEGSIRAKMLVAGCVEAVVALPAKMLPQTAIAVALWVLRAPVGSDTAEATTVRFIDASRHAVSKLPRDVAVWLTAEPGTAIEVPETRVAVIAVLAKDALLNPQRWIEQEAQGTDEIVHELEDAGAKADDLASRIQTLLDIRSAIARFSAVQTTRVTVIDELIVQGVVDVRSGRSREKADMPSLDDQARIVQAKDVVAGKLPSVDGAGLPDDAQDLTQPFDVLVTTMHKVRALLDIEGGHVLSTGVYRIRVLNRDVLQPAYLAEVLSGSWNDRLQTGSTIKRAPIKDLEVPLMSLEHQQIVSAGMTAIRMLQQTAADLSEESGNLRSALQDAVRYGARIPDQRAAQGENDD